jgi:hypothetical protein
MTAEIDATKVNTLQERTVPGDLRVQARMTAEFGPTEIEDAPAHPSKRASIRGPAGAAAAAWRPLPIVAVVAMVMMVVMVVMIKAEIAVMVMVVVIAGHGNETTPMVVMVVMMMVIIKHLSELRTFSRLIVR